MDEIDKPFIGFLRPSDVVDENGMRGLDMERVGVGGGLLLHESNLKETAPMAIVKLTMKHIDLVCLCRDPNCTLQLRLRVERRGHHPTK